MNVRVSIRYIGIGLGVVFLVWLIYLLASTLRVTAGVSREVETPDHLLRLHVVNGSGQRGLEQKVAKVLANYADSELAVEIVETGTFESRHLSKTLVVAREPDRRAAILLAKRLHLDPSDVVYEPLEHNTRQISATLVLGEDFDITALQKGSEKETK